VVLIGVDLELQRRMAEGIGLPGPHNPTSTEPSAQNSEPPNFSAHTLQPQESPFLSNIGAPITGAPCSSAPEIDGLRYDSTAGLVGAPELCSSFNSALEISAPELGEPDFNVRGLLIRHSGAKSYTVRPVSRMEDAFSSAERELLRWLWERGRPVPVLPRIRLVTGPNGEGARRLATQAGLIYNTFKNLTRSLSAKFALDIVKPEKNLPTIYAVYEDSAILVRQRERDFTRVVHKNGGGRELVNAQSEPARRRPDLTVEQLEQIIKGTKI
jgi:hypothetical protein